MAEGEGHCVVPTLSRSGWLRDQGGILTRIRVAARLRQVEETATLQIHVLYRDSTKRLDRDIELGLLFKT